MPRPASQPPDEALQGNLFGAPEPKQLQPPANLKRPATITVRINPSRCLRQATSSETGNDEPAASVSERTQRRLTSLGTPQPDGCAPADADAESLRKVLSRPSRAGTVDDLSSRTVFATHYQELNKLVSERGNMDLSDSHKQLTKLQ